MDFTSNGNIQKYDIYIYTYMYTQTARTIIYYTLLDITHRTYTSYSSYVHGNTYVCIQCRVHIYIHPYIHACMHTYCFLLFCFAANRVLVRHSRCIHTNICTSIHICMHVYERTYVRTYVRIMLIGIMHAVFIQHFLKRLDCRQVTSIDAARLSSEPVTVLGIKREVAKQLKFGAQKDSGHPLTAEICESC